MDRASLSTLLHQGLSLDEIGARLGRHPSTVAYWVKKHGFALSADDLAGITYVILAGSLSEALTLAAAAGEEEAFVGGGAALFAEALPRADRLYLTRVLADVPGDVLLPDFEETRWREVAREHHPADERHAYPFVFVTLEPA